MKTYRTFLEIAHSCYLVQICNKSSLIFTRIFVILYLMTDILKEKIIIRAIKVYKNRQEWTDDYVQENYEFFGSLEK